ncbi:Mycobacterium terramassiliense ORFan [Mycobacterium terramassiliense]|uniref:Mycobacterium terramassiliense ORFan n=1 Tax=Mycobacterium terramassiliense TaxID=1841859 RepID=A0A2U3N6P7_9MYCO|nr:Mycobacterium terramassiliense ORFan [Mycobacterium terramassiliense]
MAECDVLEPDGARAGVILSCQARPAGAELRVEF